MQEEYKQKIQKQINQQFKIFVLDENINWYDTNKLLNMGQFNDLIKIIIVLFEYIFIDDKEWDIINELRIDVKTIKETFDVFFPIKDRLKLSKKRIQIINRILNQMC